MRQLACVLAIGLFGVLPANAEETGKGSSVKPTIRKVDVPVAPEPALAVIAELVDHAKELLIVGACAEGSSTKVKPEIVAAHCKTVRGFQDEYKKSWLGLATAFFKANMPAGLSKTVVYPFAGGDLSTALTVYPDADEITTLSLEPAGDARALARLTEPQVKASLAIVATELGALYTANFSKTMNMIGAMRSGQLPTQLIFSLSALRLHGYDPVGLRYFKLDAAGDIVYLTERDLVKIDAIKDPGSHNRFLGNVELKFRKVGGTRDQVWRHIMANLDNAHLKTAPAPLLHLKKKGHVSGMTKAASYLLSFGDFSTLRTYIIDHVDFMVSDTTGVPPSYGVPAGFTYETWGDWKGSNMPAGNGAVRATWMGLFAKQEPKRELAFRFGYPNNKMGGHLVVMKRGPKPVAPVAKPVPGKPAPAKPTPAPPTK